VLPHIVGGNRDPKVVWHEPTRRWIMVLYLDGSDFGFFSSPDLKTWTHLHDMTVPGCSECPDFFEMPVNGDPAHRKWVWTAANGHYLVGSFDGQRFTPESGPHVADWGANFYAVQTYSDIPPEDGRRIQIAWMRGGKYPGMPFNQQMSFPCELTLRPTPDGLRLFRVPVREIATLHAAGHAWADTSLMPGENLLDDIEGDLQESTLYVFDIRAEIELGDAAEIGFRLRGETVSYAVAAGKCTVCKRKLSCLGRSVPLAPVGGRIRLQILLDRTSIEVFGNDGAVSLTSCFLPEPGNRGLEAYAAGGVAEIVSMNVCELCSAWPNMHSL
jgi:sucrose-6-phosphate hydrolase SacC (GH32 family)